MILLQHCKWDPYLLFLYFPLVALVWSTVVVSFMPPSSSGFSDLFSPLHISVKLAAMPDFARVYSFLGSIFDPETNGHLQTLKEMDPIDAETVSPSLNFDLKSMSFSYSYLQAWSSCFNIVFFINLTFYMNSNKILNLCFTYWMKTCLQIILQIVYKLLVKPPFWLIFLFSF